MPSVVREGIPLRDLVSTCSTPQLQGLRHVERFVARLKCLQRRKVYSVIQQVQVCLQAQYGMNNGRRNPQIGGISIWAILWIIALRIPPTLQFE